MTVTAEVLDEIRQEIAADDPLLAAHLRPPRDIGDIAGFSDLFLAAAGSGADEDRHFRFSLEYIHEGYLLHYATGRLIDAGTGDFSLLAGDYMYARGLNRVALLDDLGSIRILAGLVSLCAHVHCEGLDSGLALDAWSASTLCLAFRAAGHAKDPGEACAAHLEVFRSSVWSGEAKPGSATKQALAMFSPAKMEKLRRILIDVYSSLGMKYEPVR